MMSLIIGFSSVNRINLVKGLPLLRKYKEPIDCEGQHKNAFHVYKQKQQVRSRDQSCAGLRGT